MSTLYMKLRITLLVFSVVGLILYIVAFAIPKWSKHNSSNEGLWQMCFTNAGIETCSVWPDNLKSSEHKIAQVIGCLGLVFCILFVFVGAMTIFWTSHWKKAKAMKYSVFVFGLLAVTFLMVCVFVYKNDKESNNRTISLGWYLAFIGSVIVAIATPFYLLDACRTVAPKKPDKISLVKQINNIPPTITVGKFLSRELNTTSGNSRRHPLLTEFIRQNTTFIHPPPEALKKKITKEDIESFPLPPSKTKLDLMEITEIEDHPAPLPPPTMSEKNSIPDDFDHILPPAFPDEDNYPTETTKNTSKDPLKNIEEHSVFKFRTPNTIYEGYKTDIKEKNRSAKLLPAMMVISVIYETGDNIDSDDINGDNIDGNGIKGDITTTNTSQSQFQTEETYGVFAPEAIDVVQDVSNNENRDDKNSKLEENKLNELSQGSKKRTLSTLVSKERSLSMKAREQDVYNIYGNKQIFKQFKDETEDENKKEEYSKDKMTILHKI